MFSGCCTKIRTWDWFILVPRFTKKEKETDYKCFPSCQTVTGCDNVHMICSRTENGQFNNFTSSVLYM